MENNFPLSLSGLQDYQILEEETTFDRTAPEKQDASCHFKSQSEVMAFVMKGKASVQNVTPPEVQTLLKSKTDLRLARDISSDLSGFSRIFFHSPGEPRDESEVFLTHVEIDKVHAQFESPSCLMSNIAEGRASVQKITPAEVKDLLKSANDPTAAYLISSDLSGFCRVYYHEPGEPRDEKTLILTHSAIGTTADQRKVHGEREQRRHQKAQRKQAREGKQEVREPDAELAVCAQLTGADLIAAQYYKDIARQEKAKAEDSRARQWVKPPTILGKWTARTGRRALIVSGMTWRYPDEDHFFLPNETPPEF